MADPTPLNPNVSPRWEDSTLTWYVGDTFTIDFHITLTVGEDELGVVFSSDEDSPILKFEFYNKTKVKVHEVIFGGTSGNLVDTEEDVHICTIKIDEQDTKKFPAGEYSYCITFEKEDAITTIYARGEILVESCH